jgi:enamine deaminase RidA (YjgF/YER057c/UK114 family)
MGCRFFIGGIMDILRKLFALSVVLSISIVGIQTTPAAEIRTLQPATVAAPFRNRYSHGKIVPDGAEWLITAGQTGSDADGNIGNGIEEQADFAMRNLFEIVREAGMSSDDVIKMTIYFRDPAHLSVIVAARNRYFGEDFAPASTAIGVSALARPEFLIEVELIAARLPED